MYYLQRKYIEYKYGQTTSDWDVVQIYKKRRFLKDKRVMLVNIGSTYAENLSVAKEIIIKLERAENEGTNRD